jgi:hypothetical protein
MDYDGTRFSKISEMTVSYTISGDCRILVSPAK